VALFSHFIYFCLGWQDVPVVAMETFGAHCFNLSVKAKKLVALEKITR
jgi:L-serine/L-threonine ammonia-lyase